MPHKKRQTLILRQVKRAGEMYLFVRFCSLPLRVNSHFPRAASSRGLSRTLSMRVPTKPSSPLTERVLNYWYGESRTSWYDSHGDKVEQWFFGGTKVDEEIREMFSSDVEAALEGEHDSLLDGTSHDSLALVILLDQFTRNLYRGSARAFSGDAKAVEISRRAAGEYEYEYAVKLKLRPVERTFMYMPLMHSEILADQKLCVRVFENTQEELKAAVKKDEALEVLAGIEKNLEMAIDHLKLIEKFGRFPHRNKALGRESTPEEIEYLKDGATYGQ